MNTKIGRLAMKKMLSLFKGPSPSTTERQKTKFNPTISQTATSMVSTLRLMDIFQLRRDEFALDGSGVFTGETKFNIDWQIPAAD